jgi:hypothetical protein
MKEGIIYNSIVVSPLATRSIYVDAVGGRLQHTLKHSDLKELLSVEYSSQSSSNQYVEIAIFLFGCT